jgi:hypothetical protein
MTHSTHHNKTINTKREKIRANTEKSDNQKIAYALRGGKNFQ